LHARRRKHRGEREWGSGRLLNLQNPNKQKMGHGGKSQTLWKEGGISHSLSQEFVKRDKC